MPGGTWADLGAGTGTFTRALRELLGPNGVVYAVDRSEQAVRALRRLAPHDGAALEVLHADFTGRLELPPLDGVLMANALHYARDQAAVLRRITALLRPGGRVVLVEYDRTHGNRWVPFPVPPERFRTLAAEAGLGAPRELGRRPSAYWREMYAAAAQRPEPGVR
ncbi:MAG: class I SAM-dependent methyltransferase [Gemmatimonadaceae bacterium]